MTSKIPALSPFKLLQSYEKQDIPYYFGREKETRQLYNALLRSKFMMIYGASGAGKTSLIQCGLQSMYSPRDWMPVFIRRQEDFPSAIRAELYRRYRERFEVYRKQQIDWYPDDPPPEPEEFESLRDLIRALFHLSYVPIYLILDQFEEIFTLGDRKEQDDFFLELEALNLFQEDLFCKIIMVSREEYIAHFYRFENQLPFLFEYRFRVEKMRQEKLLQVVKGVLSTPYPDWPAINLESGTTPQILKLLTDDRGEVDLTTLQVYLDRLYQEDRKRADSRDFVLIDKLLVEDNKLADVLSDFIDRQVGIVSEKLMREFPRTQSQGRDYMPMKILSQMVTSQGTKVNRSAEEIYDQLQIGKSSVSLPYIIACLKEFAGPQSRILNPLRYAKTDARRFEIMHDRLADRLFAKFSGDELRRREAVTTIQNKLKRYREIKDEGLRSQEYLSLGEIELVDQSLNTERLAPELKAFVAESRNYHQEQEHQRRKRLRQAIAASIVFALVAILAVVLYFRADHAEQIARYSAKVATSSQLASMAQKELTEHKRHEGLLLAEEAYQVLPDSPPAIVSQTIAEAYYLGFQQTTPLLKAVMTDHNDRVLYAWFSPDGQEIASVSTDSTAKLWNLEGQLLATFRHQGSVQSVQFSPRGDQLLTASQDKTVKLWDKEGTLIQDFNTYPNKLTTAIFSPDGNSVLAAYDDGAIKFWSLDGSLKADFQGHQQRIVSLAFSPDGKHILSTSWDQTARLWNFDGKEVAKLQHNGRVFHGRFSPDGQLLLTGGEDNMAALWSLDGRLLQEYSRYDAAVRHVDFSPDGSKILTASYDGTAKLWNLKGVLLETFRHRLQVRMAVFSSEGNRILTVSRDNTAKIWDLQGNLLANMTQHNGWLNCGQFSSDGTKVVTASLDSSLMLWDLKGEMLGDIRHQEYVHDGAVSPDGQSVLTASYDGTALISDLQGNLLKKLDQHSGEIFSACFSHDGQFVLTASTDSTAKLWSLDGSLKTDLHGHQASVVNAVFAPDDQSLLTASEDHTAKLWELNGALITTFTGHQQGVRSVAFSPDGQQVLTASEDNTAKLWNREGKLIRNFPHDDWVTKVLFSPDGRLILTLSRDGTTTSWNLEDSTTQTIFSGHSQPLFDAVFSRDGQFLLTASQDSTARLWNIRGGLLQTFRHQSYVTSVAFSPDEKEILTASADHTARLWDLSGNVLLDFPGHSDRVQKALFSPDGQRVFTFSWDGTARIWPLPALIHDWTSKKRIIPFTQAEREAYGLGN